MTLKINYAGLYRAQHRNNKILKRQKIRFSDDGTIHKKPKKLRINNEEKDDTSSAQES